MGFCIRPFGDPAFESGLLLRREDAVGVRRRHHDVGIGRADPFEDGALFDVPGVMRHVDRGFAVVEAEVGLGVCCCPVRDSRSSFPRGGADVAVEVEGVVGRVRWWARARVMETTSQSDGRTGSLMPGVEPGFFLRRIKEVGFQSTVERGLGQLQRRGEGGGRRSMERPAARRTGVLCATPTSIAHRVQGGRPGGRAGATPCPPEAWPSRVV